MLKYFTTLIVGFYFIFSSCKKDNESQKYGSANIIILNDTLVAESTSSISTKSYGLNFEEVINTTDASLFDYYVSVLNTSSNNQQLSFIANDYNLMIATNDYKYAKKYDLGDVVDGKNTDANQGNLFVSSLILKKNERTNFSLNETAYLGICYNKDGEKYNGWVKIKTLNNYHSCIIVSYAICKEKNKLLRIQD